MAKMVEMTQATTTRRSLKQKFAEGWRVLAGGGPDGVQYEGDGICIEMPSSDYVKLQESRQAPYKALRKMIEIEGTFPLDSSRTDAEFSMEVEHVGSPEGG